MASHITSITGLQNLPNLQYFRADWNALQTLDLSGLTNLILADVSDNDELGSTGLKTINLSGCTSLEEIRLDDNDFSGGFPDLSGLNNLNWIDFDQCGITGSIDISNLPSLRYLDLSGNLDLTEVIISSTQPLGDAGDLYFNNCALTQNSVDNILVQLSLNSINGAYLDLTGGTNASPGPTGLAASAVLAGRGWSVNIN